MASTIEHSNELAQSMCVSGYRYLYGAKDQSYTTDLVNQLSKANPEEIDRAEALRYVDKGYMAVDCAGFVCKVLGIANKSPSQLESTAVKRIEPQREKARPGMVLWKPDHVAYVGENLTIYEALDQKSGIRKSTFENRVGEFEKLLIVKDSALAADFNSPECRKSKEKL